MFKLTGYMKPVATLPQAHSYIRFMSNTSRLYDANEAKMKKHNRDQLKESKKKLKRMQLIKNKNKQHPELHPLYMDVPTALKYLRAAEVGNPAKKTTLSILMTIIPDKGSKPISGSVFLPRPIKDNNMLVFSLEQESLELAKARGATVGGLELIEEIKAGNVKLDEFTQCFATPDIVKDLKAIARYLGPKNLMPSTKKGTVSEDVSKLMEENVGALPFKQRDQHLSIPIGRCDFSDKEILQNLKAASDAIYGCQPPGTKKPNLIGQTCLSSTIGPSVVINFRN